MTDSKCDVLQHALADVWVVKEREIGNADQQVHCRTHLGHLLTPGDVVLGSVLTACFSRVISCSVVYDDIITSNT